jgi:hypothetical protein
MNTPVTPIPAAQVAAVEQRALGENYFERNAVAFDKFLNSLFAGAANETISSRVARGSVSLPRGTMGHDVCIALCDVLNRFQADHGARAELGDLARAQQTVATLEASPTVQAETQPVGAARASLAASEAERPTAQGPTQDAAASE